MRRRVLTAGALLLFSSDGRARQPKAFSEDYSAVVTLENIGGVVVENIKAGESSSSGDIATIGLFSSYPGPLAPVIRLGFHYFVLPPLSVGVNGHLSDVRDLGQLVVIAGRIGVAIPIDTGAAIWPRAGVSYFNYNYNAEGIVGRTADETAVEGAWIGGESLLVLQPVEHFGFIIGPMLEVSVAGKRRSASSGACNGGVGCSSQSREFTAFHYGITFGVLTDF